ncbi:hypothetical protein GCM10010331_71600 [Streptomyces xanthochromogenes]|uniref:hypothetical protein n=1 Tax=Streptomyces TaxID=1883 RepID=UPI00141E9704|nr:MULTISPECIES: hypothetical protein [Streptomyces]GHB73306.1 hypothetical protein GCM10010331_71600 [Streptomyces xanthochromogenes]
MGEPLLTHAVKAAKWARGATGRARLRAERLNTVPALGTRGRPLAQLRPVHLSVLGGRTLNLALLCPSLADGAAEAELLVESHGRTARLPLELEPQADGRVLLTLTTPLCHARLDAPQAKGLRLRDGIWRLTVVTTDRGGRQRRAAVASFSAPVGDGPTLHTPPDPVTGVRYRVARTVDGHAVIKVTAPQRQAELTALDLKWDRITVRGRLLAAQPPHDAYAAEAVRRTVGGAPLPIRTHWQGTEFTFDLPLAEMSRSGHGQRMWDVRLRSGGTRIRIARRLTDVRHPKRVFRTPFRAVALEDGSVLRVHAHLSAAGTLAVSCAPFVTAKDSTR